MLQKFFKFDKKQVYSRKFELYDYIWYRNHRLFFHSLIFRGRKLWAFNFFVRLKYELKIREQVDPYWIFLISVMKITPEVILFPKKFGGKVQWIPLPIGERKQYTFTIKWIIKLMRDKYKRVTLNNLAETLIQAIYEKGDSYEKKISVYQISLSNRHLVRFLK